MPGGQHHGLQPGPRLGGRGSLGRLTLYISNIYIYTVSSGSADLSVCDDGGLPPVPGPGLRPVLLQPLLRQHDLRELLQREARARGGEARTRGSEARAGARGGARHGGARGVVRGLQTRHAAWTIQTLVRQKVNF